MANGTVTLIPDSTGKIVDCSELTVNAKTVERQRVVLADPTGAASFAGVDAFGNLAVSTGGTSTAAVAAAATSPQVIKATPGRLCRIHVTAAGSAALNFYDNATAASGTVIGALPAVTTLGQTFDLQMPAAAGITAGGGANTPGYTVSFS